MRTGGTSQESRYQGQIGLHRQASQYGGTRG